MKLIELFRQYQSELMNKNITFEQKWAIHQILSCKTEKSGQLDYECNDCHKHVYVNHSCGHRFCPQCGFKDNQNWLNRQQQKLLPVDYFMVTFTLPFELRSVAKQNSKQIYAILMKQAVATVQEFSKNDKNLAGQLGVTAVLHTHARNLSYHPHVHLMVPAGSLSNDKKWRVKRKKYLFKRENLAKVFRGKFIDALKESNITCKQTYPKKWVAHCKKTGNGASALKYLSHYLYRGVFSEKNLLELKDGQLTWKYKDSETKKYIYMKEPALKFLLRLMQHVLPKGFQRVRNYGLLHGSNNLTIKKLQLMLRVQLPELIETFKVIILCTCCGDLMTFCRFIKAEKRKVET
ncbi:MAG: transposase [Saccharospirillaceae bacterium]|nr:transposase [Saccharospirillaceae bacterium]